MNSRAVCLLGGAALCISVPVGAQEAGRSEVTPGHYDSQRADISFKEVHRLPDLPMPVHPYQNNDGYSGAHGDSYNSHAVKATGPTGAEVSVVSYDPIEKPSLCSTQSFDAKGRVITVCVGQRTASRLLLLDPETLQPLATYELPPMAGFYFRMDEKGDVVIPSGDRSLVMLRIIETESGPTWKLQKRIDLSGIVPIKKIGPRTMPMDVVADWKGNWWFVFWEPAIVGFVDPNGNIHARKFPGESIRNGLAASKDGVFFVTDKHLYGVEAGKNAVTTKFRTAYDSGPSRGSGWGNLNRTGSGTTPTILAGGRIIAFGDNSEPRPNALVYRLDLVPDSKRLICKVPLFEAGETVLENSFIGYDHSMIVGNNKGFTLLEGSADGRPGLARIDVRRDLTGCDLIWENDKIRAATGPKLSLGNSLIYFHDLEPGTADEWYITAIDFRTGKVAWRTYLGKGQKYDNALLTLNISPTGLLVSGKYSGLVGVKDVKR